MSLLDQLISHEGTGPIKNDRHMLYQCPAGKLTIGIGRNLEDRGISRQEAIYLCLNDIESFRKDLQHRIAYWPRIPARIQEVLINMCFNMGIGRLMRFKRMFRACEAGDYETMRKEMLDSRWAGQVGRRAVELADIVYDPTGRQ